MRGQIAHIDRNRDNNEENNLAYLCLRHHDDYDSKTSQSKRFQPGELTKAKATLERWVIDLPPPALESPPLSKSEIPKASAHVRPELFDRRIPIYRAFHRFIVSVLTEAKLSDPELSTFVKDTHDALFLYGAQIEDYLHQVYVRAVELRSLQRRMAQPSTPSVANDWENIVNKETDCILWFNEQLRNGKRVFYPYLKL